MTDDETSSTSISAWVDANPIPTVLIVLVLLIGLGLALRAGDDEPEVDVGSITSTPIAVDEVSTTTTVPTADPNRPEVAQVTCERLITSDEADAVLFEGVSGPRGMLVFSQGETCLFDPDDESGNYLRIEPGDPADFAPAAQLGGVSGRPVDGIADAARWFDDGTSGVGILSVGTTVEVGALIYRIHVGLAQLSETERLERARELAMLALPRFPFVEVEIEEPEPEIVVFDDEPVDRPPLSLDDVLYERVESGEWTLGEGLVTMLRQMNDGSGADIDELIVPSASGVIAAAQTYVADGLAEADVVDELLDQLLPSREELDALTITGDAGGSSLTVSLVELAQVEPVDQACPADDDSTCYLDFPPSVEALDDGKYVVKLAQPSAWTDADVAVAQEVLSKAAVAFETAGTMPPTMLVLRTGDDLYASYVPGEDCRAFVGDFLVGGDPDRLRQVLARELAICFINADLFGQLWENPNPVRWVVYGLANYLSGVVYPNVNLEHVDLPGVLAQQELNSTMPERTWTNWIFFEHAHASLGADGTMALLRSFPERADLVAQFAAVSGMSFRFHDLELALSDADVKDVGIGKVPYSPLAWELPISGPTQVPMTVPRFGVRRLHIQVSPGEFACVESSTEGDLRMSWRKGAPGGSGAWSTELPTFFNGEAVMTISSVEDGASYTLDITAVEDSPADCDEEEGEPGGGGSDPIEALCQEICDPSTYYWGPLRFGT